MKKYLIIVIILISISTGRAQNVGLSFSYFVPRNGYFSTPISPFSIRGLGVNLTKFLALETGASLYRMSGLNVIGLPFESKAPITGPNFTLFIPAELILQARGRNVQLDLKGGGFFFYAFDQKLNYGNLDRAIRKFENWEVANSTLQFKNHPGFGFHAGLELTITMSSQFALSIETNYLMGSSKLPLIGTYTGGTISLGNETKPVDYKDSKVDFTGFEFSIGLIFGGGGGSSKPKNKKRR